MKIKRQFKYIQRKGSGKFREDKIIIPETSKYLNLQSEDSLGASTV